MEGVQYRYNTLAALGSGAYETRDITDILFTPAQPVTSPSASAPSEKEDQQIILPADELGVGFIGFDDEPAEEADTSRPEGSPRAAEEPSTSGRSDLPWMRASHRIRSPSIRLHNELVEFCRFLAPSSDELASRQAALARVTEAVQSIWPSASVQVFGSFVTGLYLPSSDMDIVVMDSQCGDVRSALKAVANSLVRKNMAKNIQIIAKAKVPIIKFEDTQSGVNFDVSFDAANGPEAADYVKGLMERLPPMRPLVLILKVFLHQRELNEVYQGGIGSYALLVMVAAFLLLHPSRGGTGGDLDLEANVGVLLLEFLRLYGRSLNTVDVGVSCRKGGCYFGKRSRGMLQPERPFMLAVEDPKDPSNDLGKGSYNIQKVRGAFDFAYQQLTAAADEGESLLERVVRLDTVLMCRRGPTPQPSPIPEPAPAGHSGPGAKRRHNERAASANWLHETAPEAPVDVRRHKHRRKHGHGRVGEEDEVDQDRRAKKRRKQEGSKKEFRGHKHHHTNQRKRSRSHDEEEQRRDKPKKSRKVRERDTAFGSCESGELVEERGTSKHVRRSSSHVRFSEDD